MQQLPKAKKSRLRYLEPYLPRADFGTLQQTLDRSTKHALRSQTNVLQTFSPHNPFSKKPDRYTPTSGQTNMQKITRYLENNISVIDATWKRKEKSPSLRYDRPEEHGSRSPYAKPMTTNQRRYQLDKSNKIRSESVAQNLTPTLNRNPKSSLSNPNQYYNKHRRVTSLSRNAGNSLLNQNTTIQNLLEQARKSYEQNKLTKAIDSLETLLALRKMPEAEYLLGVCLMNHGQLEKAVSTFLQIIESNPSFRKNMYLLAAISNKRMNKLQSALSILGRGLKIFPDDYDCLLYRGKLFKKLKNYQKAIEDFHAAGNLSPSKGLPYIQKSDCLRVLGRTAEAIEILTEAINSELKTVAYTKKGILLFESKEFQKALENLNKSLEIQNNNCEAHFYKGMAHLKMDDKSEALLSFDELLKLDNNPSFVSRALQQILKIHIVEKDFYEAYHIVVRAEGLDIDKELFREWKVFIDGILLLMKKKFKEGVEMLTELLIKGYLNQNFSQVPQDYKQKYLFFKPLLHFYRAYGYFCLNDLRLAKIDYQEIDHFSNQTKVQFKCPSKDYNSLLINAIQGFPDNSIYYLQESIKLFPNKTQPYLYMALAQVQQYIITEDADMINNIRRNLDIAVSFLPQLSNNHISSVYYYRAVINLYRNDIEKAVADIDKAIQKSEDNIPKYFYLRGLIFACCTNFQQAIQDYSISINLNKKYAKPYLQRAKCLQIQGDSNEAFLDLQKYISLRPGDALIHKFAGIMLFQNGAYKDCLLAFAHGSEIQSDLQMLQTKMKCKFALGELDQCLSLLDQFEKQSEGSTIYMADSIVVSLLNSFNDKFKGCYQKGVQVLGKIIQTKRNEGKLFKERDLHLLLAACYACTSRYDEAIQQFKIAIDMRIDNLKQEKNMMGEDSDSQSVEEVGWSVVEATYSMSLCYLAKGEGQTAYDIMSKIQIKIGNKQDSWFIKYRRLLSQLNSSKTAEQLEKLNKSRKHENKMLSNFFSPIPIKVVGTEVLMPLQFQYPQVDPPEIIPQFDHDLFLQFAANKIEPKPEAPWINRNTNGVIFTSNIQVFDNLELSKASKSKQKDQRSANLTDQSGDLSKKMLDIPINKRNLRDRFKLDSQTQEKLQRIFGKKQKIS